MSGDSSTKVFSKEHLLEHVAQNADRTFLSIHDNIYDVTEFLDEVFKMQFTYKSNY